MPNDGIKAEVEDLEHGKFTTSMACPECMEIWTKSGLPDLLQGTKWNLVRNRRDVAELVCVFRQYYNILTDYELFIPFSKGPSPLEVW